MSVQVDWDFSDDDKAKAEIAAAVKVLLRDRAGNARSEAVQEIISIVHDAAAAMLAPRNPLDAHAVTSPAMSGIIYKAFVIDAFQRDTDKWRATIRRLNGKKIRVAVPPSVQDEATTSADALTAEKAVELAKQAIDGGGLT
jgi:predicted nucleic acid-binding protein